ncbi:DUF4128 domain-containing protein [Methylobacterium nodulans]|uniref:Tail terminator n=1 Tax=Methylobacterium nodulans (strain LMG 21967 / CNCM I-2342 / ORS 2060) TaxID=460265 RepID=B8IIV8_METNO|nr:DUF4128 domain-containing protein [Methylobacterium nodulans]ACL61753.1 conserved hypothetical protein [Methylobacterium nodulans ORS 2060]
MAATGTEAKILDALLGYLAGLTFAPPLPVAQPGVAFAPQTGKAYLEASFYPNTAGLDGLPFDSDRTHAGLFVLTVVWPTGQGLLKPLDVAAQVRRAFAAGTRLWRDDLVVCVDEVPQVDAPVDEAPWVRVAVTVRWRVGVPADA